MRQELRKILARVFVALLIFLIGVVIYKQGNPYAYPGLENRILFVLVPLCVVLLYLYLEEQENRNRLLSVMMVTIGRLRESKFMRFCGSVWKRSPLLIRTRVSKVLVELYTYLHKISGYVLKQDPKQVVSHAFLGMLLIVALQSIFPQPSLGWARTPVMIAAVALGVVTFYLNRDKLGDIEEEARQEEIEEKRREMEFGGKYPRINRVWGVRWIVRWMYKEGWWYSGILILVIGLSIVFMLNHLGQFMSVDEPKWFYIRVPQLYESFLTLDFAGTYINDKPGILPAALSGIAFLFLDPSAYTPETLEKILFWWRLPIVLFNVVMSLFIYEYLKKLFNQDFAILCISLIVLNPIIIGISQIVNPDATLWSTGFISILMFFLYLKTNLRKYIYISGLFLGLALLSKYFIAILYPFFILVIVIEYLLNENLKIGHLNTRLYDLSILSGISILFYTLFFPATWINPEQILKGTLGAEILIPGYFILMPGLFILFSDIIFLKGRLLNIIRQNRIIDGGMRLISFFTLIYIVYLFFNLFSNYSVFDLDHFLFGFSRATDYSKLDLLQASSYVTLMTVTPFLLFGLLMFFVIQFTKGFDFLKVWYLNDSKLFLYSGIILILIYMFGSSLGGYLVDARYQIILYPIYSIIATTVIISLIRNTKMLRVATIIIIMFSTLVLFNSSPFYLQYNNAMNVHHTVISTAWGFGGYELAQEANKLQDAQNLTIWSDREGFNEFFIGKTYWRGTVNPFEKDDINYLVLTNGGQKMFTNALKNWNEGGRSNYAYMSANTPLLEYYNKTPIYQINIGGNINNKVMLVRVEDNY